MIIDHKSTDALISTESAQASTSDRKLSIELPNPKQVYTAGSPVAGIVHLGTKDLERTLEIKVSVVCIVRSFHHKYYGGSSHDIRRETNHLIHRDQVLWSSSGEDCTPPPADIPFNITIPDVGNDKKAKNSNTALPPSFQAGSRHGWRNFGTYGTPIGFIKYHVKVVVARKGTFTLNNKAFHPFVFLPPSSPPPLLPSLPEGSLGDPIHLPEDLWDSNSTSTILRHIFSTSGHAQLQLWLPRVSHFPRNTRIPFVLCFVLTTLPITGPAVGRPCDDLLPPAAQVGKATLFLQRTIRTCARGGKQTHLNTLNAAPTDNMLHDLVSEEGEWTPKEINDVGTEKRSWEKRYVWRGVWTCRETPNFANRQITWEYALVGEIPIKGLGNDVKLVTKPLEISSGVTAGTDSSQLFEENELDLPPDYFELDGAMNDDDDEEEDEKSRSRKS